jgi:hypothetical protein
MSVVNLRGVEPRSSTDARRRWRTVVGLVLAAAVLAGAVTGVVLARGPGRGGAVAVAGATATTAASPNPAASPASLSPSPSASPSPSPSPSASPSASTAARLPRTRDGLVIVPDEALLAGSDLPDLRVTETYDGPQYVKVPTTSTSVCATEPLGLQYAVGGRSIMLAERDDNSDQWSLSSAVRVFGQAGAKDQIRWLQRNLGTCAGTWGDLTAVDVAAIGDGAALAYSTTTSPRTVMVLAAVRSGRVTSGFQLFVPPAAAATDQERVRLAVSEGTRLLGAGHRRLVATLGPASVQDPSLR